MKYELYDFRAVFFYQNTEGVLICSSFIVHRSSLNYLPLDLDIAADFVAFAIVEDVEVSAVWNDLTVP
jgi:hypothetical protein